MASGSEVEHGVRKDLVISRVFFTYVEKLTDQIFESLVICWDHQALEILDHSQTQQIIENLCS